MNFLLISLQSNLDAIGVKYVHYGLLEAGHGSHLLHLPRFDGRDAAAMENLSEFIRRISPGFIGISLMSAEFGRAAELTGWLKKTMEGTPVVWGGVHPTIAPETCVGHADYVCVGEGEKAAAKMADASMNGSRFSHIGNLCFNCDGAMKRNPLEPWVEDLDGVPLIEHIARNGFVQEKGRIIPIDRRAIRRHSRFAGMTYETITSRGCPFTCTFCCSSQVADLYGSHKVRRRSVENILAELERAARDNPEIECINLQDDCFLSAKLEYIEHFCSEYRKRVGLPFIVRSTPRCVDRTKMQALRDAGMTWIELGLQSASERTCREVFKRASSKDDFLQAVRIAQDLKTAVFCDVILDNPFETDEDRLETVRALSEAPKPIYTQFFSLNLYIGTELHRRAALERPADIDDSLTKDYLVYRENPINDMTRIAAYVKQAHSEFLAKLYLKSPSSPAFKCALFILKALTMAIYEPVAAFRVIKLTRNGSWPKTFAALPYYFKEGFRRYLNQFKTKKNLQKEGSGLPAKTATAERFVS